LSAFHACKDGACKACESRTRHRETTRGRRRTHADESVVARDGLLHDVVDAVELARLARLAGQVNFATAVGGIADGGAALVDD